MTNNSLTGIVIGLRLESQLGQPVFIFHDDQWVYDCHELGGKQLKHDISEVKALTWAGPENGLQRFVVVSRQTTLILTRYALRVGYE